MFTADTAFSQEIYNYIAFVVVVMAVVVSETTLELLYIRIKQGPESHSVRGAEGQIQAIRC